MIKFFRHFRQQLLAQNQFTKYLAYAIGEIILVVIGILIALSLNSWDQNQTDRKKEILELTNLSSDLEEQAISLKEYVKVETMYFEYGISVLRHYARHKGFSEMEDVLPKLNSLVSRRTFNPVNTTFRELISTGGIGLIQNDSLRRAIMQYYHHLERITLVVSNNNARLVDGLFNPVVFEQTLYLSDIDDPEVAKINDRIFDDESLKNLRLASQSTLSDPQKSLHLFNVLEERMHVADGHRNIYEKLQIQTRQLQEALKREMKKLD